jgi:Tfp pilus assembly protein PilF
MTERGLALFGQGKIQEAIDQFTKAIALDPSYLAAWQRRAEAYQRLGRPKEAAEDIRRLQALGGHAQ